MKHKLTQISYIIIIFSSMVIGLVSCNKTNNKSKIGEYNFSIQKNSTGYYLDIEKSGLSYSTKNGSIGICFDKNEFRIDEPIYSNYESLQLIDDTYIGTGSITSKFGTIVQFKDYYNVIDEKVVINRSFEVTKAGEDNGFMVEQKWTNDKEGKIIDNEWFIPASYYVNGENKFQDASSRMYFSGSELTIPADDVSALMVSSYNKGKCISLKDQTTGNRETIIQDRFTENTYLYIDENINIPGIKIKECDNRIEMSHIYPSYTNRQDEVYIYRLLPVVKGQKKNICYCIEINEYDSYDNMLKECWRDVYKQYEFIDKRYDKKEVYNNLILYLAKSYSENNIWGNIPQYMTTADHYFPDSGFLYRNLELATIMLTYGREVQNDEIINNAWKVINYQIENDKLDNAITAYSRDNSVFKRILYEGLGAAVELYAYEIKINGSNDFLDKLLYYIVNKAKLYENDESLMALNFYVPLYKHKDILFTNYEHKVNDLLNKACNCIQYYKGYYGAIESDNTLLSCAEDYMIILRALIDTYEIDKNEKWLNNSIKVATYLETFQMIQPLNMNPLGATGLEGYNLGFIGNERFLGYGYIFNNTNHGILDCANTSSTIEYYKLYQYTHDEHFKNFADMKLTNSLLYVNMGDKIGYMDDTIKSSGIGFINEFSGNATTKEGYADGGIRGAVHDSIIGWNIYEIIKSLEYNLKNYNDDSLIHNLSKGKYVTNTSQYGNHLQKDMIDDNKDTYWLTSTNDSTIIDLNEICYIDNIVVDSDTNENGLNFQISNDNKTFEKITNIKDIKNKGQYIKIDANLNNIKVSEIKINGYPVFYKVLSYDSVITNNYDEETKSAMASAIDRSNYNTAWGISKDTPNEMTLDLKEQYNIYQTAIKFGDNNPYSYKILVSNDNMNYDLYSQYDGQLAKYVYVDKKYCKARYIKLIVENKEFELIKICDFKVCGSE